MKLYAVHFEDDASQRAIRLEHQAAHDAYIRDCGERIVTAGVLQRDGGEAIVGGWWLVRGASELEVRGLIEADPFFTQGLRRTTRVWQFSPTPLRGAAQDE